MVTNCRSIDSYNVTATSMNTTFTLTTVATGTIARLELPFGQRFMIMVISVNDEYLGSDESTYLNVKTPGTLRIF